MAKSRLRSRSAFTLVEVLVVIVIMALMAGLLLPAIQKIRENSQRTQCLSQLRQLAIAMHSYRDNNSGYMPPFFGYAATISPTELRGSWFAHLMPSVEEKAGYQNMRDDIKTSGSNYWTYRFVPDSSDSPATFWTYLDSVGPTYAWNGHVYSGSISPLPPDGLFPEPPTGKTGHGVWKADVRKMEYKILRCPADTTWEKLGYKDAHTSYLANWHVFTRGINKTPSYDPWHDSPPQNFTKIVDGLPNTVMLADAYSYCDKVYRNALVYPERWGFGVDWDGVGNTNMYQIKPDNLDSTGATTLENPNSCNNWTVQSRHAGMHVAMFDGTVKVLSAHLKPILWGQLLKPADSAPLGDDWQNP